MASADDSIHALHHLGRALADLVPDQGGARIVRRRVLITELARACAHAAAQWPAAFGPVSDLAGGCADTIVTRTRGLTDDERWAAAVEVTRAVAACAHAATRFAPYAKVPTLVPVQRLAVAMNRVAALDPPQPAAGAWLDRHIASPGGASGGFTAAERVVDATADLTGALQRDLHNGTLNVYSILAASAVAEICAEHAESIRSVITRRSGLAPQSGSASHGWRVVQAVLVRFDDGSRHPAAPRSQIGEQALTLHRAVAALADFKPDGRTLGDTMTAVRFCANQLPAVAASVTDAMQQLTQSGRLLARARNLPRSEEHVVEVIHDKVVIVTPRDIGPVLISTRATERLSTALALDLDRTAARIGTQPQPRLIAAMRETMQPELHARDARWAERLAGRCEPVRPATLSR